MENKEKQYIRANVEAQVVKCRNCGKEIIRRDLRQIVYYCSKECRKYRNVKQFKFVRE